jgi:undecaprenyl-phosphate 4-deoxy-4-formamido-L-arabinose transferase
MPIQDHENLIPGLTVLIPVYRGAANLPQLLERLEPVLRTLSTPFEVILVNDGSPDDSWQVITESTNQYDWVHGIDLLRNYGQQNALLCGMRAARYETTVTMDDDLQHPPEAIPHLLAKLSEGFDVVYGTPKQLTQSKLRNALSASIKRFAAKALGISGVRDINSFRAFRTKLRAAFADFRGPKLFLDPMLAWGTDRFASVEVQHQRREHGSSNYGLLRLVNQTLLMLTSFSTLPLRLASLIGLVFLCIGFALFAFVLIRYLSQGSQPGFPFLASTIILFSGAQLFALGIIGEYLATMFHRLTDRPTYVVRAETEHSNTTNVRG